MTSFARLAAAAFGAIVAVLALGASAQADEASAQAKQRECAQLQQASQSRAATAQRLIDEGKSITAREDWVRAALAAVQRMTPDQAQTVGTQYAYFITTKQAELARTSDPDAAAALGKQLADAKWALEVLKPRMRADQLGQAFDPAATIAAQEIAQIELRIGKITPQLQTLTDQLQTDAGQLTACNAEVARLRATPATPQPGIVDVSGYWRWRCCSTHLHEGDFNINMNPDGSFTGAYGAGGGGTIIGGRVSGDQISWTRIVNACGSETNRQTWSAQLSRGNGGRLVMLHGVWSGACAQYGDGTDFIAAHQ